jgi:MoaA/NifB/PqqE/SkfB family radical SAM enzyme
MMDKRVLALRCFSPIAALSINHPWLFSRVLAYVRKRIYRWMVVDREEILPHKIKVDQMKMLINLLEAIEKALHRGNISKPVRRGYINSLIRNVIIRYVTKRLDGTYDRKYGGYPPFLLVISPTKKCNLRCRECYAASSAADAETMSFSVLDRIIQDKKECWDSYFNVISGGEPFLWRSEGKDIFDIAKKHSDCFFLLYTNGTLITEEVAAKLQECGNISPAISIEGLEKETDERRGKGVFKKILEAFALLRRYGVPFGISVTATKYNLESILREEVLKFYFDEQQVMYGWLFHYMPIGRAGAIYDMITPDDRVRIFNRFEEIIHNKGYFFADFWGNGTMSLGCMSALRDFGYAYIDWNGDIMPCVFVPFKVGNIHEYYRNGGSLADVRGHPLLVRMREWQKKYGFFADRVEDIDNYLAPCIFRDHFDEFSKILEETNAVANDEQARQLLDDEEARKYLIHYGKETYRKFDGIWKERYCEWRCRNTDTIKDC